MEVSEVGWVLGKSRTCRSQWEIVGSMGDYWSSVPAKGLPARGLLWLKQMGKGPRFCPEA